MADDHRTAVLLIAWRRPDALRKVIKAIRPLAPTRLFVACDGPSSARSGEAEKVAATRAVIEDEIDWSCQIERLYSATNQGCSIGPIRAISWFFEQVEEGIILEDDCVPHAEFIPYCAELLERYRHDTRVWNVSGSNFQKGLWRADGSYYFSHYFHGWGWASWKRCWQHFDPAIQAWPAFRDSGLLQQCFPDSAESRYWHEIFERTYIREDSVTWWDYQWLFICLINGGLTILPNRNLVNNIGFGPDASHTTHLQSLDSASGGLGVFKHPSFLIRHAEADQFTYDHHFGGLRRKKEAQLLPRVQRRIDRLIQRIRRS